MKKYRFFFYLWPLLVLGFAGAADSAKTTGDKAGILQRVRGDVVVVRNGKEEKAETGYQLKEKDQILTGADGRFILQTNEYALEGAPQGVYQVDLAAEPGRPAVFTIIYGHLRVTIKRVAEVRTLDRLRIRVINLIAGIRSYGLQGVEFLVHVCKSEEDCRKTFRGEGRERAQVLALSDMKIFEEAYTQIEVLQGVLSVRAEEAKRGHTVAQGQQLVLAGAKASEPKMVPIRPEELRRLRKALGL